MSNPKLLEMREKRANLESKFQALALEADQLEERLNDTRTSCVNVEIAINELDEVLNLIDSINDEKQEAFNTLCIAQATGGATDADFQTFAQEADLQIPQSEAEEESDQEAA